MQKTGLGCAIAMDELILASTSPARRALMDSLGLRYRAVAPDVDERVPAETSARDAVAMLSQKKARAVFEKFPNAWVIGADQLATVEGRVLSKPAHREAARAQLLALSGREHEIVTGVT